MSAETLRRNDLGGVSQAGAISPPTGHLATSRDILDCPSGVGGRCCYSCPVGVATQHPPLPGTAPVAAALRLRNRVLAERQEGRCDRSLTCTGLGRKTRSQGLGRGKTTCGRLIRRRECERRSTYNGQSLDGLHVIYIHKGHSRDAASLLPPFLSPLLCLAPLPTPVSLGPSLMPSAGLGTKCHLVMCFVKGCLNFIQTDNVTEMTPFSLPFQEHSMLLTHFVCSKK